MLQGFASRAAALAIVGLAGSLWLWGAGVEVILPRTIPVFVAFETAVTLTLLLVSFLAVGRFLRRRRAPDLLLVAAFTALGVVSLLTWALPVLGTDAGWDAAPWQQAVLRLLAALLLVPVAWSSDRPVLYRHRPWPILVAAVTTPLVLLLISGVLLLGVALPAYAGSVGGELTLHPLAAALEVATVAALTVTALVMAWRDREVPDPFLAWLMYAVVALALSRGNDVLDPSLDAPDLHVSDAFRLLAALLLLIGALREIGASWRGYARGAIADERRRVARDLHDGVAHELAYILGAARELAVAGLPGGEAVHGIQEAAARALDETRAAISAVNRLPDEPVELLLEVFALQVAARYGGRVVVRCEEGAEVPDDVLGVLLRIVREAVTNAMVHGGAGLVRIDLESRPAAVLRIHDDGHGFDPEALDGRGFGLTTMRERAGLIGGRLRLDSAPGAGTTVEVTW